MVGAGITAFYMSRLFFMTFHGEKRWEDDQHPHESPLTMTIPMMVLAFGSAFLGLILGHRGHHVVAGAGRRRGAGGPPGAAGWLIMVLTLVLVAVEPSTPGGGTAPTSCPRWRPRAPRSPARPARTCTRTP